jgi:hypothetical protein
MGRTDGYGESSIPSPTTSGIIYTWADPGSLVGTPLAERPAGAALSTAVAPRTGAEWGTDQHH